MASSSIFPDRATLTPSDYAFLESPPSGEERAPSLPPEPLPPTAVSTKRRVGALLTFTLIMAPVMLVLLLAILRVVARDVVP